jgi:hypothetical protein
MCAQTIRGGEPRDACALIVEHPTGDRDASVSPRRWVALTGAFGRSGAGLKGSFFR